MHSGAGVDTRLYTHLQTLDVVPSSEGLVRLTLAPEDLAVSRDDLALWIAIVLAVAMLGTLTLRLSRREGSPPI